MLIIKCSVTPASTLKIWGVGDYPSARCYLAGGSLRHSTYKKGGGCSRHQSCENIIFAP
jgi:hypothetical protein